MSMSAQITPGELMPVLDPLSEADPWATYATCRKHSPVSAGEDGAWFLFRYTDVRHALTDSSYGVEMPFRASRRAFGPSMLDTDGVVHERLRQVVQPPFRTRIRSESVPQLIASIARGLLEDECMHSDVVDLAATFAFRLPVRVFCSIMGIPEEDAEWWYTVLRPIIGCIDQTGATMADVAAQRRSVARYFSEKAHVDGYDRAGLLAHITGAFEDDEDLTEVSLFSNALMLMAAGTETTGLALANLLAALLRSPEHEELLRGDPKWIAPVVQESLRLDPPLHMIMRVTAADEIVRDVLIPAGSVVHLCLASANRDEEYFEEPDVWRLDRRSPPALTFARGKHACLGSALALLELEVALRTLHEETTAIHFVGEEVPQPSGRAFRGVRHLPVVLERRGSRP